MKKTSYLFEEIEKEHTRLVKEIEAYEKERDMLPKRKGNHKSSYTGCSD